MLRSGITMTGGVVAAKWTAIHTISLHGPALFERVIEDHTG